MTTEHDQDLPASRDRGTTVGIDLGGTNILAVAARGDQVVGWVKEKTPIHGGPLAVVDALIDVTQRLTQGEVPAAIGVGAPGAIDHAEGVIRWAPNLPGWLEPFELAPALSAAVGDCPVHLDNDVNVGTLAEAAIGAGQGCADLLGLFVGTGVGGGLVLDGQLRRGPTGFAGEIGHMVVDPHGPVCPCGRAGCWERYASGSGLGRLAREAAHAGRSRRLLELAGGDPESVRGEHVTLAAQEGDAGAVEVMERFAWWLAAGLANLANIFDPAVIVIGGGLVEAGEVLMAPTRREFLSLVEAGSARPGIGVLPAALGERAGAIGAAALARL